MARAMTAWRRSPLKADEAPGTRPKNCQQGLKARANPTERFPNAGRRTIRDPCHTEASCTGISVDANGQVLPTVGAGLQPFSEDGERSPWAPSTFSGLRPRLSRRGPLALCSNGQRMEPTVPAASKRFGLTSIVAECSVI